MRRENNELIIEFNAPKVVSATDLDLDVDAAAGLAVLITGESHKSTVDFTGMLNPDEVVDEEAVEVGNCRKQSPGSL